MANKVNGFTVVLEDAISEEAADALSQAISQLRGVISVSPHTDDFDATMAQDRARRELGEKLFAVLYQPKKN